MAFMECMALSQFMSMALLTVAILIGLFLLIFIIGTLVHQAINKRWAWFVFTLILVLMGLGFIIALVYWIIWILSPKFRGKK